ncbi:MAG: hypothetical protein ACXVEF_12010 [Polyangiales bacterium]
MRIETLALAALMAACSGKTEDSPLADAAGDGGTDTPSETPSATCSKPVAGDAPFAVTLTGSGSGDGGTVTGSVNAYFPNGRVAGKEVVISFATVAAPHFAVARGVLDASLSASMLRVFDPDCGDAVAGTLVGPSGGLDADVGVNRSGPGSDAIVIDHAHALLCPTGTPPAAEFSAAPAMILPTEGFSISGNTPIDRSSLATIATTPAHPIGAEEVATGFYVSPKRAFPPFAPTTIDLSGVRDVMGRSLGFGTVKVLTLTADVVDPTFAAPPPDGAMLGSALATSGGSIRTSPTTGSNLSALIALGTAKPSKKLRLRQRLDCKGSTYGGTTSVALVSEAGAVVDVVVKCLDAPADTNIELPTEGRWALAITSTTYALRPCMYPGGYVDNAPYELDEFAFE